MPIIRPGIETSLGGYDVISSQMYTWDETSDQNIAESSKALFVQKKVGSSPIDRQRDVVIFLLIYRSKQYIENDFMQYIPNYGVRVEGNFGQARIVGS